MGVQRKPLFAPGTAWAYSNTNYITLGLILQKVTNRPVGELVEQRISQPRGLTHTDLGGGTGFRGTRTRTDTPTRRPTRDRSWTGWSTRPAWTWVGPGPQVG